MAWSDGLALIIPVAAAGVAWLLNEHSKRRWEQYKRKEDRYVTLVQSLTGFYEGTEGTTAKQAKEEFLTQLNLCWLYCPDKVIHKAYHFLSHVETGARKSDEEKQNALGAFVLELRTDLLEGRPLWRR